MLPDSSKTALCVTCIVDQLAPQIGAASVRLLRACGCSVAFPEAQTCCGQPAFNMGYRDDARRLARRTIEIFEPYGEIVAPSGSCASMLKAQYPELFSGEPEWHERAQALAAKVFELSEYLLLKDFDPSSLDPGPKRATPLKVSVHDSCHALRELGVREAPRALLRRLPGVELIEMQGSEVCCGFGGTFAIKMEDLSIALLNDKIAAAEASGADVLTATDYGCLMHLGGALSRRDAALRVLHIAEILSPND